MQRAGLESYVDKAISDYQATPNDMFQAPSPDSARAVSGRLADLTESAEQEKRKLESAAQDGILRSVVWIVIVGGAVTCILLGVVVRKPFRPAGATAGRMAHVTSLRPVRSCPICQHIAKYNPRNGKWYCSHCRRKVG